MPLIAKSYDVEFSEAAQQKIFQVIRVAAAKNSRNFFFSFASVFALIFVFQFTMEFYRTEK